MKIGTHVENFQLKDQFNNKFDLYENLDHDVLLVFYPKDNSPVCTKQLVDYSLNQKELGKFGIRIVGVNIEPVDSHSSFCENNKIDFPVLSDPEKNVSKYFEAINLLGNNKRKLVLVGKDKTIKFERLTLPMFFVDTRQLLDDLRKTQLI
ncbi:MAG TPA: peroxiredoxin [Ignavibacteriales bacterium]|nr:peroxiredoxin [Ignavibacteriales bacterium]